MAQPSGPKSSSPTSRTTPTTATPTTAEGLQKIGKYEIQKKIGAGGMGAVYLAVDPGLKRSVALKVLPPDKAGNPTLVKRFKAEAQAAANLRHENIVMIYEAGEAEGQLYIALEYVEGTDVANLVQKRGVMPVKRTIDVIRQTALALQHAHEQGIVHRDIKPGNLLIRRDGVVKLADMGLARAVDDNLDTSITRAGTTVGTVDYMSPEQARDSKAADVRSDLYSLGCTWYYMLTGVPPFPDGSMTNKLRAHAENPIPDPRDKNPGVTEAIYAVIRRMTEKNPARRYQTPKELIEELDSASISRDIVSEAILGEIEEETATVPKRKGSRRSEVDEAPSEGEAGSRPRKRPVLPALDASGPGLKPGKEPKESQVSEFARALPFYFVAILLAGGVIGGLAWIVMQYSSTIDGPRRDPGGNPFADDGSASAQGMENPGGVGPDGRSVVGGPGEEGAATNGQPGTGAAGSAQSVSGQSISGQATPGMTNPGQVIQGTAISGTSVQEDKGNGNSVTGQAIPGSGLPGEAKTVRIGQRPDNDAASGEAGSTGTGRSYSGSAGGNGAPRNSPSSKERRQKEDSVILPWTNQATGPGLVEGPRLARLVVRRGATDGGRYPTINAALEKVPAAGALILLEGPGPFPLSPMRVADKTRIVFRVEDASRTSVPPLVILVPESSGAPRGLEFANTTIELHDFHLGVAAPDTAGPRDGALLRLQGGDLTMIGSSISATGAASGPNTAIRFDPPQAPAKGASHLFLDHSTIRGNGLTALSVDAANVEVVLRDSFLWSGTAPALRFSGSGAVGEKRRVQVISTTISSATNALAIAGDGSKPVPTTWEWINSLAAASKAGAPLVQFDGWKPEQIQQELGRTLTWKSTDSLYAGWKPLVRLDPTDAALAGDSADWQKLWKDAGTQAAQFPAVVWPTSPIDDIARFDVARLSSESIGKQFVKTSEGGWPGCASELLVTADLGPIDPASAPSERIALPAGLFDGPNTGDLIKIDLTKQDLGKVLSARKIPNGARIVASGHGTRQSSPITIQNAWVRMKFEQTDGPPLVIQPRSIDSGQKEDAFLTVQNGGIEISGGAFSLPPGEKPAVPRWFAQVTDGDLALSRCRIHGAFSGSTRNRGFIQWVRGDGRAPARPFEAPLEGYLALRECFLAGAATLIDAELRHRGLYIRDSVLVSLEDAIRVSQPGAESQLGGTIDLETSTISAAGNVVKVAARNSAGPAILPLNVFADRCVFAPPLRTGTNTSPALLSGSGSGAEALPVQWWESHSGYAPDFQALIREEAVPGGAREVEQAWRGRWGESNVIAPLMGPQGVVLAKDLPTRAEDRGKIEPGDFLLHPASRGATWDGGDRAIGAPLAGMKVPPLRGGGQVPSGAKTKPPKAPAPVRPGF